MTLKITATKIHDKQRLAFLPKYFGKRMLVAEHGIYNAMSQLCSNYDGAFWHFYELSNGGFYMAPDLDEKLEMCVTTNGYEGVLSADAAGIVTSLCVINQLCWQDQSEKMINYYYLLRDFATEHNEASEIFAAID